MFGDALLANRTDLRTRVTCRQGRKRQNCSRISRDSSPLRQNFSFARVLPKCPLRCEIMTVHTALALRADMQDRRRQATIANAE